MKPRIIIAGLMLAHSFLLSSQRSDSLWRIGITTSITDYIPTLNLNTGNLNLGVEAYINNSNSIYVNVGLLRSYGKRNDLLFVPSNCTQGGKLQLEFKHFIGQHGAARRVSNYFSVQLIGQRTATERQETFEYLSDSLSGRYYIYRQDIYYVSRSVVKANLKVGAQLIRSSGFTMDASLGIGAQYITSKAPRESGFDGAADIPWNKRFNRGSGIYPNLAFQIHAGWTW